VGTLFRKMSHTPSYPIRVTIIWSEFLPALKKNPNTVMIEQATPDNAKLWIMHLILCSR